MKLLKILTFGLLLLNFACTSKTKIMPGLEENDLLFRILSQMPAKFNPVFQNPEKYRLQILYTQIDRDENNVPAFTKHGYRLQTEKYFYPARPKKVAAQMLSHFMRAMKSFIANRPRKNDADYKIEMRDVKQGKGHYSSGKLQNNPIDFTYSNYVSIEDFQDFLIASYFPESFAPERRFNLKQDDYNFLYKIMSMLPRESNYPAYSDTSIFHDGSGKLFIFGGSKTHIPGNIRIFNKTGGAYGYLT